MKYLDLFNEYYVNSMGMMGRTSPRLNEFQFYLYRYFYAVFNNKIKAVKLIKRCSTLGLKESKDIVDYTPLEYLQPNSQFEMWLDKINNSWPNSSKTTITYRKKRKFIQIVESNWVYDDQLGGSYHPITLGYVSMKDITKFPYDVTKGDLLRPNTGINRPILTDKGKFGNMLDGTDDWQYMLNYDATK